MQQFCRKYACVIHLTNGVCMYIVKELVNLAIIIMNLDFGNSAPL